MITVNCGAIPEGIIESELFGHTKGSYTGASSDRKGYFESAHKGTIFLDEIGEMPLDTQVKVLRVLESGEFMRVGDSKTLVIHPASTTHSQMDAETMKLAGLTEDMIRFSDGIEDVGDIIEDFENGFRAAKKPRLVANQ